MARAVKGTVKVVIELMEVDTAPGAAGAATARLPHRFEYEKEFTSGTVDGTALDRVWSTEDQSFTTTPTDLDLSATAALLSKLNNFGVSFADLAILAVKNKSSSGDIQVGAGSNPVSTIWNTAGDGAPVKPDGLLLLVAPNGYTITAATADILRLVASAGTVVGDALLAGRSA